MWIPADDPQRYDDYSSRYRCSECCDIVYGLRWNGIEPTEAQIKAARGLPPMPGEAVRLTADWMGAKAGSVGVIDGLVGVHPSDGLQVTFRPSVYRDDVLVRASGGPGTLALDPSRLFAKGETHELRCWRFMNGIRRAGNSEEYTVAVPLWEWNGR